MSDAQNSADGLEKLLGELDDTTQGTQRRLAELHRSIGRDLSVLRLLSQSAGLASQVKALGTLRSQVISGEAVKAGLTLDLYTIEFCIKALIAVVMEDAARALHTVGRLDDITAQHTKAATQQPN